MKKLILILALAAAANAQQMQKLFPLKYADPNEIKNLLNVFPANVSTNREMRVIAVTATKETLASIEEALKTLDVAPTPHKNVEVTGYVVLASLKTEAATEPADIAGVIKQMRTLFPYKTYRLVETIVVRGRDGQQAQTGGFLSEDSGGKRYEFATWVMSTEGKLIRLDKVTLKVFLSQVMELRTDVDLHEGQKVVVGKSNMTGGDGALILVLSAKVVD